MVQTTQGGRSTAKASKARRGRRTTTRNARSVRGGSKKGNQRDKNLDVQRVFVRELMDVSDAHDQLGRLLSGISAAVNGREIRDLISFLESRTEAAKRSLDLVLEEHGQSLRANSVACKPMRAMAQEATKGARTTEASLEMDLLTITNLQKMLHYLIASLGSLRAWSELVEDRDAVVLFRHLTDEMKSVDRELSAISESELWSRGSIADGDGGSWSRDARRRVRS